jgi:peptide-methionine (S)-S-oxide reductase
MLGLIKKRPGALSSRVGYARGDVADATYTNDGTQGEAIDIGFDPEMSPCGDLLGFL